MIDLTISPERLYATSKPIFFKVIPDFEISACFNCTQMFFNLRSLAKEKNKTDRIKAMAIILNYAPKDRKASMRYWLDDYFSPSMQADLFGLERSGYSKALENEIKKLK